METEKQFKANFEKLKEYMSDVYHAIDYCDKNAGTKIENLSVEASERDRLDMLKDEVDSLNRLVNNIMGDYLSLAQDVDKAIEELSSDTTIFTLEEKNSRALNHLKGGF